jgi:hypothetical protein
MYYNTSVFGSAGSLECEISFVNPLPHDKGPHKETVLTQRGISVFVIKRDLIMR